ncbi:hypothetical protein QYF36_016290 [Acer negundo]|nr:hypothetical protein QYF36_016290 [Acer negundo]
MSWRMIVTSVHDNKDSRRHRGVLPIITKLNWKFSGAPKTKSEVAPTYRSICLFWEIGKRKSGVRSEVNGNMSPCFNDSGDERGDPVVPVPVVVIARSSDSLDYTWSPADLDIDVLRLSYSAGN